MKRLHFPDGSSLYVNPEHVVSVHDKGDGNGKESVLQLRDTSYGLVVKGSADEVMGMLE